MVTTLRGKPESEEMCHSPVFCPLIKYQGANWNVLFTLNLKVFRLCVWMGKVCFQCFLTDTIFSKA